MSHPAALFGVPVERVRVDPGNRAALAAHLACAALEAPLDLDGGDRGYFGPGRRRRRKAPGWRALAGAACGAC